ncbi:ATP-binding protein [Leptolyngbya cf. ectocarpi LEGE 11479]|uniref:ATP-binding protein n=1 Tax=Leptolyngbya cf. ectocarpi LEGE 11479 TaxID=1828722 RepID=A0A928X3N1_LEPEC|nr:ATP-binding protein [Leptolyngbya cf. ectocarpi LEGE 11479]
MLDVRQFFQTTNPARTLDPQNENDRKLYIDFSEVRGEQIITEIKDLITFYEPENPTCTLFTGHIGCGKSTELLKLRVELEAEGFHVVYFESTEDLEMADVDIGDVLLAIARRISQSLEDIDIGEAKGLRGLLQKAAKVLMTEIELEGEFSLAAGIGKITARAKNDATLRDRLNQFLGPQKNQLVEAINEELLKPAIEQLKQRGKKGLVVIVDNLDRIDNRPKAFGRSQQEYLFIDQHECLQRLLCHKVYTIPLALKFSSEYGLLTARYTDDPKVLPMVPVKLRNGQPCDEGMRLLRQLVLARAMPGQTEVDQLAQVPQLFDQPESLDRLCMVSGGHVRDLLRLLNGWVRKGRTFPLKQEKLEEVIRARRNEMTLQLSADEWTLLRQVRQQRKKVGGDDDYQRLIHSRLVFEYRDQGESWFDVNPILLEAEELKES